MDSHPEGNQIVAFSCTGDTLKSALENAARQDLSDKVKSGEFLQFSGVKVRYDMKRPVGKRVAWVKVRCGHCPTPTFEEIQESRTYNVVAPDYIVTGANGFAVLKQKHFNRVVYPLIDVDIVSEYITRNSPISTGERETIVFVKEKVPDDSAKAFRAQTWLVGTLAIWLTM